MTHTLFLFRRDLRLDDNDGFAAAAASPFPVTPLFVFDPRQVEEHPYRSTNAVFFLVDSLRDLAADVAARGGRLRFFYGAAEEVTARLLGSSPRPSELVVNADYTPFASTRDEGIARACAAAGVRFSSRDGVLLRAPAEVKKGDGGPYTVFTPFYKKATAVKIPPPTKAGAVRWADVTLPGEMTPEEAFERVTRGLVRPAGIPPGGRKEGLRLLERARTLAHYDDARDVVAAGATSNVSPHLKFGTVSPREVCAAATAPGGPGEGMVREVVWRDFFTHVAFHFPRVFGNAFHDRFDRIEWSENPEWLERWKEGMTGFPMVDAGMRELKATGYMHNRARLVTGSFLVKDLLCDWREGERHFARLLVDYDPSVNNGNWQWVASTGCDAQPYFRVFNPWNQQKKFDPGCEYVKRWVPELAGLPAKDLHNIPEKPLPGDVNYPRPIVDHAVRKTKAAGAYAAAAKR